MAPVPPPQLTASWDLGESGPLPPFSDLSSPLLISLHRSHSRVSTHLHKADAQLFLRKLEARSSVPWTVGAVPSESPPRLTFDLEGPHPFSEPYLKASILPLGQA